MNHIIILGPAHPYRGGVASCTEILARTFGKQGKRVDIITFLIQYPKLLFPGKTQFSESSAPADLHIIRLVNSINPLNWWRVGRRIRKMRPDVLILKYWTPYMAPCLGTISRIIAKNRHTVILTNLHNIIPHEKHFFDRIFTRYFVDAVDGFLYMSQQVKDELDTFITSKPALFAPHPVFCNFGEKVPRDVACHQLGLPEDKRYVLFFGLIRDYKGLDLLFDAWAKLLQNGFTADKILVVAGEFYTDKTKYLQQIEHLGIYEDVLLHDCFIRDDDVRYYFSMADVVVQPYKSATQSGVTQIAYQFETPMIVTDVGGLSEIVPDGQVGYVVEPDAAVIAKSIEKIYENNNLQRMTENMITEKQRFSWDYFAGQMENLYELVKKSANV
jgi:glycosyltransferase involved in cell wall biosynthesis